MELVSLGPTGRSTTQLGFGGSRLMTRLGMKRSLELLETAFDAGIRHIDVAPSYGFGEAEECVGRFLARHPGEVTVTTKYGIEPIWSRAATRYARIVARRVLAASPSLRDRVARATARPQAGSSARPPLTVQGARDCLQRSLRTLRVERLDVWLLHEATVDDLRDDRLLGLLEDAVQRGDVGIFGIGSERSKISELWKEHPEYCRVLQTDWSVLDAPRRHEGTLQVHHSTLAGITDLHAALTRTPQDIRRHTEEVGADISDQRVLAGLLIRAAVVNNPDGIVLFSSLHPRHVAASSAAGVSKDLDECADRLYGLVRRESARWGLTLSR